MVLAVPPENLPRIEALAAGQDVEATVLGTFTGDGRLKIYYGDRLVGDLSEHFLHDGIPQRRMTAEWNKPAVAVSTDKSQTLSQNETLLVL